MNDEAIKALIETQVVLALKSAPEAIDALVKAALSKPVEASTGSSTGYGAKMPYLEWLVGETIRFAASEAARKVIREQVDVIEGAVRKLMTSDMLVEAFAKALTGSVEQDWRITVKFEPPPRDQ